MIGGAHRVYLRFLQWVYDLLYLLVVLLGSPVIAFVMLTSRRWRAGLWERLGGVARRHGDRPTIWIHGVSNGEVLAAKELVKLMDAEMPWAEVVISTTTRTGHEAAARTYPGKRVVYYPLDFSFATRRAIERLRPNLVLLMELELWPNFLLTTSLRDVPVLLANGRMSAKSARDYRLLQRVIPEPMTRVLRYCVQTEEYAARFRSLGVAPDRITITGSMKFDNVADGMPAGLADDYRRRLALKEDEFVIVGGSTHAGEETVLLAAMEELRQRDPNVRLVLVPRHPERLREVDALVRGAGLVPVPLSRLATGWPPEEDVRRSVVVVDTTGELARLYVVADVVYVGGTLTRRGGQNMMEPAGLGKPVVVGPNTWNFRDPMELLLSRGGIVQVEDSDAVRAELVALHGDAERRARIGGAARRVCIESKGATRRILQIVEDYVPNPAGDPDSGRVENRAVTAGDAG